MRHALNWLALIALVVSAPTLGCNFTEDLDQVREDALSRQDPSVNASELCIEYCQLAESSCNTDDTRIFADDAECYATCADYPTTGFVGTVADRWGDSVQCRIAHLETAASLDPATHCPHGSPEGGGKCTGVSPCARYCAFMEENCVGAVSPFDPENFLNQCFEACLLYAETGDENATSGDSYECRLNAAINASTDANTFCAAAAPDGGDVCTDADDD